MPIKKELLMAALFFAHEHHSKRYTDIRNTIGINSKKTKQDSKAYAALLLAT